MYLVSFASLQVSRAEAMTTLKEEEFIEPRFLIRKKLFPDGYKRIASISRERGSTVNGLARIDRTIANHSRARWMKINAQTWRTTAAVGTTT
jgi:hypothetical protein